MGLVARSCNAAYQESSQSVVLHLLLARDDTLNLTAAHVRITESMSFSEATRSLMTKPDKACIPSIYTRHRDQGLRRRTGRSYYYMCT